MTAALSLLLVEASERDATLLVRVLHAEGLVPAIQRVETEEQYLAHLDAAPDLILAETTLPHFGALRALHLLQERGMEVPFIVVSGSHSEESALACLRAGATDYLLKDRLGRLG